MFKIFGFSVLNKSVMTILVAAVRQLPIHNVLVFCKGSRVDLTQSFARHIYWRDLDPFRGNYDNADIFLNEG